MIAIKNYKEKNVFFTFLEFFWGEINSYWTMTLYFLPSRPYLKVTAFL